jgi:hypothetical protein
LKMGQIYSVSFSGTYTAAGTDTDLLEILPADDKPVKLRGFVISQTSEVGDAQEEGIRISVIRLPATVTSGSGGSAPTPIPPNSADAAAGMAAEVNNTTVATTSGTAVTLAEFGWNERNSPFDFWWPDAAFCPKVKQGEGLVVRGQTTVADDLTIQFTAWLEEE